MGGVEGGLSPRERRRDGGMEGGGREGGRSETRRVSVEERLEWREGEMVWPLLIM